MTPAHSSSIQIGEHKIAFRHNARHPSDGAIVLIHGAGCSSQDWPRSWLDGREAAFGDLAVYALDLPEHGASGGYALADIPAMAALVTGFIKALGLTEVCLVGHSMGSAVAIACALQHQPDISRLVLVAGAARFDVQQGLLDGLSNDFEITARKIAEACWHGAMETLEKEKTIGAMLSAGQATLLTDFTACRGADFMDQLHTLSIPVLAIAAAGDRLVKVSVIQEMCARISRCELKSYSTGGHFLHLENPGEIADLIGAFVSGGHP